MSGARCEVSGARCQVSGVRCQVSDVRSQVSGVRCQMSGVRRFLAFWAPLRRRLGGCRERLEGTWVPLEGPGTALGRLPGGSWQALGGFQEVSWTKDRDS